MIPPSNKVLDDVRRALGREYTDEIPPHPPELREPIIRLVHTDIGLPELFAKRAKENKIDVQSVRVEELPSQLIEFLRANNIRSAVVPVSPFLERIGVIDALRAAIDLKTWDQTNLDNVFDIDCGITDVYAAVAEVGGLVIQSTPHHGRSLSLVPPVHIAIVEPRNLLPDLVDLFEKLTREGSAAYTTIITGPSKTADIEMNLVQGVHGPKTVKVFLLE